MDIDGHVLEIQTTLSPANGSHAQNTIHQPLSRYGLAKHPESLCLRYRNYVLCFHLTTRTS